MPNLDLQPPLFHGVAANTYTAGRMRRGLQSVMGDVEAIVGGGDLLVSPSSPTGMSVQVAPGRVWVNGDAVVRQGVYLLEQTTAMTGVTIAAAHPTLPRIDLIVARDYDAAPDGGSAGQDVGAIEVITGTPNASPVAPTLPGSAVALAQVLVGAAVTSIVSANITDLRPMALQGTAHARAGGSQILSSGAFNLTMAAERLGTYWASGQASRLTIPTLRPGFAGTWLIEGQVTHPANAAGTVRKAGIQLNGTTIRTHSSLGANATHAVELPVSVVRELSAGDYVALTAFTDAGGGDSLTYAFSLTRIGA